MTRIDADAPWRRRCVDHSGFLRKRLREGLYISRLFSWPNFRFEFIHLDWMHIVCLGVAQVVVGNILWELFLDMGGVISRPNVTLARLLVFLQASASEIGEQCPFSKLFLGHLRPEDKKPTLRAKAANTRKMVPIVLHLLANYFPARNEHAEVRYNCLSYLNDCYLELYGWREGSPGRLEEACLRFLHLYHQLARAVLREGKHWLRWRWYPKFHLLLHLVGEQSRLYGNPKDLWNYLDDGGHRPVGGRRRVRSHQNLCRVCVAEIHGLVPADVVSRMNAKQKQPTEPTTN